MSVDLPGPAPSFSSVDVRGRLARSWPGSAERFLVQKNAGEELVLAGACLERSPVTGS